jgi:thioredoxin-dependent peroxiredoxin
MKFPAFSLPGSDGKTHALRDYRGASFVAYFYPKDNTTGCTLQACAFRDRFPRFRKLGVPVLGISPDGLASHGKFIAKHELPFLLLADEDHALAEALGVWKRKQLYGRSYMGIERSTFLVGKDGAILHEWRKVKVAGHVDEVLAAIAAA